MRMVWISVVAMVAVGCARVENRSTESLSADGVLLFEGTTDRGRIAYDGRRNSENFDIEVLSWGTGSGKTKAGDRADRNTFDLSTEEGRFIADGRSPDRRAGIDFDIIGPERMDMDIITSQGTASVENVEGVHVVTARRIFARNITGDVDFFADGGSIDAEVIPYVNGAVRVESVGDDVTLYVPFGLDYDLNVISDPEHEVIVEDLGFDTLVVEPGLVIGWRGNQSVQVDVVATGGNVTVLAL